MSPKTHIAVVLICFLFLWSFPFFAPPKQKTELVAGAIIWTVYTVYTIYKYKKS